MTKRSVIALERHGERILLLGSGAIARGPVERGVRVATSYPGTPASEILVTIAMVSSERQRKRVSRGPSARTSETSERISTCSQGGAMASTTT